MNEKPIPNRARDGLEIGLFAAIVVADAAGWVPITQTIFLIPLIAILLWMRSERWATIGFSRPSSLPLAILIGSIAGVLMELLAVHVTTPLIFRALGAQPDYSDFSSIQGNLRMLAIFITLSWVIAAFGEELCFRGFLMQRLARVFGDSQAAWIVALVVSSAFFGWGHTEQGVAGWVQEGLSGLLLGILFLVCRRNLAVPIVAHGMSNTVAFMLIYFGQYPGLA